MPNNNMADTHGLDLFDIVSSLNYVYDSLHEIHSSKNNNCEK